MADKGTIKLSTELSLTQKGLDTISRQAAIDAIMGEYPNAHYPAWYAEIIRALPSAERWIPVTERLPEIGVFVLISHVGCVSEDFLDIDDDDLYFWNSGLRLEYEKENIAWMPKPEPWEGKI
jgi:hypothetical protein